ncbi:hypothetical protein QYE76_005221 [Lolium multiflorum]|uniref:Ribonuclease H1 N-terminal domain-containing protein n=1 Tax=Lolium multiflorum TaxID=4521 RepID=A0AAD8RS73_LOLMU|nr:hypothetical protein QYE76_005221 [Lolium multiflorum]
MLMPPPSSKCPYKHKATRQLGGDLLMNMAETAAPLLKWMQNEAAVRTMVPAPSSENLYKHEAMGQLGGDLLMNLTETAKPSLVKRIATAADEASAEAATKLLSAPPSGCLYKLKSKDQPGRNHPRTVPCELRPMINQMCPHEGSFTMHGNGKLMNTYTVYEVYVYKTQAITYLYGHDWRKFAFDYACWFNMIKVLRSPDGTERMSQRAPTPAPATGFPLSHQPPVPVPTPLHLPSRLLHQLGSSSCTVYCTYPTVSTLPTRFLERQFMHLARSLHRHQLVYQPGSTHLPDGSRGLGSFSWPPCGDRTHLKAMFKLPKSISKDLNAGRRGKISLVMESEGLTVEGRYSVSPTDGRFAVTSRWKKFIDEMPTTYVVYKGRVPGVYDDWEDCRRQVHRFSGNSYKGYPTRMEAEGRYARYLAGEMRDMRRNRMKTMAFVMMLIVTMVMFYPLMKEMVDIGSCFIGFRDEAESHREALYLAEKRANDLEKKLMEPNLDEDRLLDTLTVLGLNCCLVRECLKSSHVTGNFISNFIDTVIAKPGKPDSIRLLRIHPAQRFLPLNLLRSTRKHGDDLRQRPLQRQRGRNPSAAGIAHFQIDESKRVIITRPFGWSDRLDEFTRALDSPFGVFHVGATANLAAYLINQRPEGSMAQAHRGALESLAILGNNLVPQKEKTTLQASGSKHHARDARDEITQSRIDKARRRRAARKENDRQAINRYHHHLHRSIKSSRLNLINPTRRFHQHEGR